MNGLPGHRVGPGDDGLAGDDGGCGGEDDQHHQRPARHHEEERVGDPCRFVENEGSLAEIIEQEAGKDQQQPGELDGPLAEVTEVGIERLGARDSEEDCTQREESRHPMREQEAHGKARIERDEDLGVLQDMRNARSRDYQEPQDGDRPEERGDACRSSRLHHEQSDDDAHRDRQDIWLKGGRYDLETLDRREHRYGRGNHRIPVEQRGTDHREDGNEAQPRSHHPLRQCHERQGATLALVVGIQQDDDILHRHDEDQRPDDEGGHTVDGRDRHAAS